MSISRTLLWPLLWETHRRNHSCFSWLHVGTAAQMWIYGGGCSSILNARDVETFRVHLLLLHLKW